MQSQSVPATAGYSGGGATVIDEHGVKTGKAYQDSTPHTGAASATAGYSGGGAPVLEEDGLKTGAQHKSGTDCCKGIHDAHGGAGGPFSHYDEPAGTQGAPTGSVIGAGAGADQPVQVIPNQPPKEDDKMTATEKAKVKTAAVVAGVQEDLNNLRQRLTGTKVGDAAGQGRQTDAPTRGERGPVYTDEQPPSGQGAQGAQQPSTWKERATDVAVKAIDKGQAALEGAKQRVAGATTQPVMGQAAEPAGKHAAQGAQPIAEE